MCAARRAYYDSNNLPEAKRTLLQAIHVAPMDHRLRFNLALVMQVRASDSFFVSSSESRRTPYGVWHATRWQWPQDSRLTWLVGASHSGKTSFQRTRCTRSAP